MNEYPKIILDTPSFCVLIKPRNMIVHPNPYSKGQIDLETYLSGVLNHKLYPVQRLDRGTSGLMVWAKDPQTAEDLCSQWREQKVKKTYKAILCGALKDSVIVDSPMKNNPKGKALSAQSKISPLAWSPVFQWKGYEGALSFTFAAIRTYTGRKHQIRKHCRKIAHPLLGDKTYGLTGVNKVYLEKNTEVGFFLFADQLQFQDPETKKELHFEAPLPAYFHKALEELEISSTAKNPLES